MPWREKRAFAHGARSPPSGVRKRYNDDPWVRIEDLPRGPNISYLVITKPGLPGLPGLPTPRLHASAFADAWLRSIPRRWTKATMAASAICRYGRYSLIAEATGQKRREQQARRLTIPSAAREDSACLLASQVRPNYAAHVFSARPMATAKTLPLLPRSSHVLLLRRLRLPLPLTSAVCRCRRGAKRPW